MTDTIRRPNPARTRRNEKVKQLAIGQAKHIDERLGLSGGSRWLLNYIFPDHWSFMFGEIALYSFIILLLTGVYVTLFFVDSTKEIIYHGSYVPLQGVKMSEAYASTLNLSFDTRTGLLMRQMHHWAALVFIGAIGVHMLRIFFTGAFRKPREVNWIIGLTLMLLAVGNGFFGYSLPDDLLSGSGLRIAYSVFESIPIVGNWLGYFLFGGQFPGDYVIPRFFVIHVFILPLLILGLLGAHLGVIMRQHHTQFPGKGATQTNVVGTPMWPGYAAKSGGYFFITFAVIALLGGIAQINPIWLFGPYTPFQVSSFTQPDWYIGWLDGALRIFPGWELHLPGHMVPNAFFPAVLIPGLIFNVLYAWPWIEGHFTKDRQFHNLLDRPRDRPARTAVGAGMITAFVVLLLGGAEDVFAVAFTASVQAIVWTLRLAVFILPFLVGSITYLLCRELSATPNAGQRKRFVAVVRDAHGGYSAVPIDPHPADRPAEEHVVPAPVQEWVGGVAAPSPDRELVGAGVPRSAATSAEATTLASDFPGVRTVQRGDGSADPQPAKRQGRAPWAGKGLRRSRGDSPNGKG